MRAAEPVQQLMLARRRAQPAAVYITRLSAAAVTAYLVALLLPGSPRPVLAPLTALLILQTSLYQTIRSALRQVLAVIAGVLAAVTVAAYVPFSWWVLGLLIAAALGLGMALRLGEMVLEVPISAMLIFASGGHAAASQRIVDTLVGAAAGLAAGLIHAPLRVQPAREAIGELARTMAGLLTEMAAGLALPGPASGPDGAVPHLAGAAPGADGAVLDLAGAAPDPERAWRWLERSRALRTDLDRLDTSLRAAEDSVRMNPRRLRPGLSRQNPAAGLRESMDALERAAIDIRVLARAVADSARLTSDRSPVRHQATRIELAAVIGALAGALREYGTLIQRGTSRRGAGHQDGSWQDELGGLWRHLDQAREGRDRLAEALTSIPEARTDSWPLRGEILAHVDRLRSELGHAA